MIRRLSLLTAAAAVASAVAFTGGAPHARADLQNQIVDDTARPLGPISVLGDSVLQGALIYAPTLVDQLASYGWGPIRAWAGVGANTRTSGAPDEARIPWRIDRWRDAGWDPVDIVVNLGANDSGVCDASVSCARTSIMRVVDAVGPGHRIWWPLITRHPVYQHQADTWNSALLQIDAERDDFYTWDWATVMATGGFQSADNTHLTPSGYRQRSATMATEITADLARGHPGAGPTAPLPAPAGAPSRFVPVASTRVLDTRESGPSPVAAGGEVVVGTAGVAEATPVAPDGLPNHPLVPAGAVAVAAYVSATNTGGPGFLTAYPCGTDRPLASNANYQAGQTRGALTIVPVAGDGSFCLYTHAAADLLVDVQGAFVPGPTGDDALLLAPIDPPQRLVDTRETDDQYWFEPGNTLMIDVPDGADAVAVNVTAIAGDEPGYLAAYPCWTHPPLSATVNYLAGEVVAGSAFVPVSTIGTICVWSSSRRAEVAVDLTGTFATGGAAALAFVPAPPTRTIDTRDGTGGWQPVHGSEQTIDALVAPAGTAAVSGTLTVAGPVRPGFLTAFACGGQPPPTSNVNAPAGATFANFVTTGTSIEGRLCVYGLSATSTIFDTTGWWLTP